MSDLSIIIPSAAAVVITGMVLVYKASTRSNTPVNTTIINLGLKNGSVTTDVVPTAISFDPQAFEIKSHKMFELLIDGWETKKHPTVSTWAYSILKHAGLEDILDNESRRSAENALTRLLINDEEKTIRAFLKSLAESTCTSVNS